MSGVGLVKLLPSTRSTTKGRDSRAKRGWARALGATRSS